MHGMSVMLPFSQGPLLHVAALACTALVAVLWFVHPTRLTSTHTHIPLQPNPSHTAPSPISTPSSASPPQPPLLTLPPSPLPTPSPFCPFQLLDVVGRARTGCGKTLAFTLPILERMLREQRDGTAPAAPARGRTPSVIIMAPTRELAKQVHEVFAKMGRAASLQVLSVYGGTPYEGQERALRGGVDVVVGTPGRIKDLMARGSLKLDAIR